MPRRDLIDLDACATMAVPYSRGGPFDGNMVADVRRMQRAGLEVQGGFILGFDTDTPSSLDRVVDFIQQAGIVTAMVGLLQAMPGTRLYQRLKNAGRLLESNSGDNVDGTTNIVPTTSVARLRGAYKDGLRRLHAPKPYYQRVRTFCANTEHRPSHGREGFAIGSGSYWLSRVRSAGSGSSAKNAWRIGSC